MCVLVILNVLKNDIPLQPKGGKKGAPPPTKGKVSPKGRGKGIESQVGLTTKGPAPIEAPEEDKIQSE